MILRVMPDPVVDDLSTDHGIAASPRVREIHRAATTADF